MSDATNDSGKYIPLAIPIFSARFHLRLALHLLPANPRNLGISLARDVLERSGYRRNRRGRWWSQFVVINGLAHLDSGTLCYHLGPAPKENREEVSVLVK